MYVGARPVISRQICANFPPERLVDQSRARKDRMISANLPSRGKGRLHPPPRRAFAALFLPAVFDMEGANLQYQQFITPAERSARR
jgi:hypothetical protein